uniref:Ankyrin repeat domain-containing protein 49 n=1 Tax=Ditylenchus dipsaci TaxID=166011 RepID=A0A915CN77_9BILA
MSSMFVSGWEDDEEQFLTAAEEGDLATLQKMFKLHPDFLLATDEDKYTPLHRAAYNNHADVCKWLLSVGADPEQQTEDGWTVLHCAACWANFNIVELLLKHGVNVNSRSHGQLTPLHLAINTSEEPSNQIQTLKLLLDSPGIDMQAKTGAGDTPIMLARRVSKEVTDLVEQRSNAP